MGESFTDRTSRGTLVVAAAGVRPPAETDGVQGSGNETATSQGNGTERGMWKGSASISGGGEVMSQLGIAMLIMLVSASCLCLKPQYKIGP
jgi:hypothetical protein